MSLVRSALFSTPLIALCTIFMGTLSLIASFFDRTGRSQHALARVWGKMLLAVSFMRVSVVGLEKLDPRGAYVFVANHGSFMDIPALLATLPQQFRFFAKKGLYSIPFLGTHLRRAGHLPVDRSSPRASLKSMMGYDDALDAFGVHAVGGFVGAILTGVFAVSAVGGMGHSGLVDGNPGQVVTQLIGTVATIVWSGVISFVILKVVDATVGLRVSKEIEVEGLDINLHGEVVQ